jgi:hypothetical protein
MAACGSEFIGGEEDAPGLWHRGIFIESFVSTLAARPDEKLHAHAGPLWKNGGEVMGKCEISTGLS